MRFVQWCIRRQSGRQVGVGDKRHAESHRIGPAAGQRGIGAGLGEALVDDVGAAEGFLDQWADAVIGFLLS
ncbi:hypothetical protein D3C80_1997660 [compost metagenome]